MRTKLFEVRDSMTFIPVAAIHLLPAGDAERYLLSRAGFGQTIDEQDQYILVVWLAENRVEADPAAWGSRTLGIAHRHILDNWADLQTGDVIDVEFIVGERPRPKRSEREEV